MRDQHRMLTGEARAELGDLRDAALKDLGEALSEARADTLKAGETKRIADGVTLTRTVARLQPNKSSDDVAGLSAWLVRTRARSALGDTALRLLFVWRDDGPPENGVWRLANDGK